MTFVIDNSNLGSFQPASSNSTASSGLSKNLSTASSSLTERLQQDAAVRSSKTTPEQAASSAAAAAEIQRSNEISVLSIAKSAIKEIDNNLSEISTLTEARESEVDPTKRDEIDTEIASLYQEINSIEANAEFNDQQIFGSSFEFEGREYSFQGISTTDLGIEIPGFLAENGFTITPPEEQDGGGGGDFEVIDGDLPIVEPEVQSEPESSGISAEEFLAQIDTARSTLRDVDANVDSQASGLQASLDDSGRTAKAEALAEEQDVFSLGGSPEETAQRVSSAINKSLVAASSKNLDAFRVESLITEIDRPQPRDEAQVQRSAEPSLLERTRENRDSQPQNESFIDQLLAEEDDA